MAIIIIPTPLRKFTLNESKFSTHALSVGSAIQSLVNQFPDLKKHLYDENEEIRSYVNLFVGDTDIRDLEKENTELKSESVLSIVPAIAGGTEDWQKMEFSSEEYARYNRHIIVPELGLEAQKKLKAAKVLVVGSGGLGSPALLYLAAAGVGTIGIVDFDRVDDSNLHRQILYGIENIGELKVVAAKKRLESLNPYIKIITHDVKFDSSNALDIISNYDVVADGTDNFPTRYLVNDAAVLAGIPNVYASIFRFDGQVSVFNYRDAKQNLGPNYRDLYPTPPPLGLVPSCAEAGVLGVLPGIIGSLQAVEVIKVITGVGNVLSGKLYTFDALTFEAKVFKLKKRNDNPLTGENPTVHELIDYEQFCGFDKIDEKPIKEISVAEFRKWQVEGKQYQLIDVREPHEFGIVNINGELIPLSKISDHAQDLSKDIPVVIHCKSGRRSEKAIRELEESFGFTNLYNLEGGILAWIDAYQPDLTKY